MILTDFDYVRPAGLDEALTLLSGTRGARLLAGGQTLLPALRTGEIVLDPAGGPLLVDIRHVDELRGIEDGPGGGLRIGALTTLAELAAHPRVLAGAPELAAAARANGDPQVRNLGTVGGNLAATGRATDLPVAAVAADALVELAGPGGRSTVPAEEFAATGAPAGSVVTALLAPAGGRPPPSRRPPTGPPATRSAPPPYASPPAGRGSPSPAPPRARCACAGSRTASAGARTRPTPSSRRSAPSPGNCSSPGAAPRPNTSATSRGY